MTPQEANFEPHSILQHPSRIVGGLLLHFGEIDSTSDEARRRATDPNSHGLAILADHQTAGRGQRGRVWQSTASLGMLLSVILRPREDRWPAAKMVALAAVAVRQTAFDLTGLSASIKWPNDILIGGRKVCGILCESIAGATIVGIGWNVLHSAEDFERRGLTEATSLAMETTRSLSIAEVCDRLLDRLDEDFASLDRGETIPLEHRWRAGLDLDGSTLGIELHTGETIVGRLTHLSFDTIGIETPDRNRISFDPHRVRHLRRLAYGASSTYHAER